MFSFKSVSDSSSVELSADGTLMRTKITPEKWPIGTQLKADAPEFVPRIESEVIRPGTFTGHYACFSIFSIQTIRFNMLLRQQNISVNQIDNVSFLLSIN